MLSDEEIAQLDIRQDRKLRLIQIRELLPGMNYKEMGRRFGLSESMIGYDVSLLRGEYRYTSRVNKLVSCEISRAKRMGQSDVVTSIEWQDLCASYQHRCAQCRKIGLLCMDHIVPLSRGGLHRIANIQPLCAFCNSEKGEKIGDLFADLSPAARIALCLLGEQQGTPETNQRQKEAIIVSRLILAEYAAQFPGTPLDK